MTVGMLGMGAHKAVELLFGHVPSAHNFVVLVDSMQYDLGSWAKVSGLSVKWDFAQYRTCAKPNYIWLSPGVVTYDKIKLSRAACSDSNTVQAWLNETTQKHKPLSGSIQLIDQFGMPVIQWELKEFFPVSWSVQELDAASNGVAIESLELIHSGFIDNEYVAIPGAGLLG